MELVRKQLEEDGRKTETAINRTNRQRKLEQRTVRMFSTTWKVEDWGLSDPRFIEMNAALADFELGKALGFGNDEEEMHRAEQFFMEMFLEKQRRTELLR